MCSRRRHLDVGARHAVLLRRACRAAFRTSTTVLAKSQGCDSRHAQDG